LKEQFFSSDDPTEAKVKTFCDFLNQENYSSGTSAGQACCFCGGGYRIVSEWSH